MPGDAGSARRVLGGRLVDDDQPRVDGGAVLGVDRAVDRGREHDAAALLQPDEGVAPGRVVGPEVRAGDRHQPPAVGETRERRGDVAKAVSAMRPATLAIAEKGGFISTTLGTTPDRGDRRSGRRRSA